jgi:PHP family Zn ribbon phosphoesterase
MRFVGDFHLHSKYSRAVSPSMTLPLMAAVGAQKGLDILSAADWTHPIWFKEIVNQLEEAGNGVYKLRSQLPDDRLQKARDVLFILSTEVASIYKQGGKLRRIHNLLFVPNIAVAEKVSKELVRRGCNLSADGRPIVGISSKHLLELLMSIDDRSFLIPCHVWTPHFGVYGSASGFDSLEEAFGEMAKYVYGIETGLSSDPEMNWQVEELRYRSILSFSDAHSAPKMGREATVFIPNIEDKNGISNFKDLIPNDKWNVSYEDIRGAIMRNKDGRLKIGYTVEFYPEEGKYHFSGHRSCKVAIGPDAIRSGGNLCVACGRKMTEGVLFRVQQLSSKELRERGDERIISNSELLIFNENSNVKNQSLEDSSVGVKWFVDKLGIQPPFVKLVPLLEIVAESLGSTVASQKSQKLFGELCFELGGELRVLLEVQIEEIRRVGGSRLAEGVMKVREGNIAIDPGYDGEYGKVSIWAKEKKSQGEEQLGLF